MYNNGMKRERLKSLTFLKKTLTPGKHMSKLTLTRIDLSLYNKEDGTTVPARFYVRPENTVSMSILSSLKNKLMGSKYGSLAVADVKTSDVVVPSTGAPFMVKQYSKEAGGEVDVAVLRLESFSTGYKGEEDEQTETKYIIHIDGVEFETESKTGHKFNVHKKFERDYKAEDKGVLRNFEALTHLKTSLQDDGTVMATLDKHDNGTYYISKFAE
jgi:hypothetical protein